MIKEPGKYKSEWNHLKKERKNNEIWFYHWKDRDNCRSRGGVLLGNCLTLEVLWLPYIFRIQLWNQLFLEDQAPSWCLVASQDKSAFGLTILFIWFPYYSASKVFFFLTLPVLTNSASDSINSYYNKNKWQESMLGPEVLVQCINLVNWSSA